MAPLVARALSSSADRRPEAIQAVPGKLPKEISPLPLLWSLWPTNRGHNLRIAFALSGLLAGKALAIWAPLQLGHLVNELGAGAEALPVGLLAAYGLARLSSSAFNELRQAMMATVSQATIRSLGRRSFEHLHALDVAYLVSNKPGALGLIVSRGGKSVQQVVTNLLFQVFPIVVEFSMAVVVMASVAGTECAMITTATMSLYLAFTTQYSNKRRELMRRANKADEQVNGVFMDSLTNFEVVKLFQNEAQEVRRYDEALGRFERDQVAVLRSLALLNFGQQIIVVGGFTSILALTASRVLAGELPVGDVVAIQAILAQLMQPLGIIGGIYRVTTQGLIDLGKLAGFLQLTSAMPPPPGGGESYAFRGGHIEFRGVHFAHAPHSQVLSGLSLAVQPGTKVAIVGPSGSGKTTLLKLLYRLVDPQQGEVLIDGQDVKLLDTLSFRRHLGIVPQDCTLFNESIGFNIRYGRPGATDEEVERAARQAQLHDLILAMPGGYDTMVGERGLMLSGGERQRVGIARCLVRNPSIVVMDEATSSLDVQTERYLTDEIDELAEGRTCLIVAHRLSTVQRCDVVAYIDGGRVLEQGSHAELMDRSPRYREFWEGSPLVGA